jgi:hypothetical protein
MADSVRVYQLLPLFQILADWGSSLDSSSPKIPEFKVWVTMGGKVLTSHKKDTFDPADVGAEIAGIEGREFQVSLAHSSNLGLYSQADFRSSVGSDLDL